MPNQPTNQPTNPPTTPNNLTLVVDTTHHYRPRWAGFPAQCHLRIWRSADGSQHIVMFTELATNRGISITNYSENLATEIRQLHGLDIDTTLWIEHYPPKTIGNYPSRKEFDRVTYTWENYEAHDPQWQRLDPAPWLALLAQPSPTRIIKPTDADWNRSQWIKLKAENPHLATILYEHILAGRSKEEVTQELQRAHIESLLQRQILCAYDHLVTTLAVDPPPLAHP